MSLTPALLGDEPALRALLSAAFADYAKRLGRTEPSTHVWLTDAITGGQVVVHRPNGGITAIVKLTREPMVWTLDILAVSPAEQGSGLGSRLLAEVEEMAVAAGASAVRLHTAQVMEHLLRFYEGRGYGVHHVGPHPEEDDGHPRVFYEKRLTLESGDPSRTEAAKQVGVS